MKILITGGCGFLGSNLASDAINKDDEVCIFDNLHRQGSQENLDWLLAQGNFKFVKGDIRNKHDIENVIKEFMPEVIFHLAGQVAMTTSIENPVDDFSINAIGTHNLLEAIRVLCPKTLVIYSSTNKVYGDLNQFKYIEGDTRYECIDRPNGFNEDTQLEFHSPYGCSKGCADQYMLDYARIYNLKTVVFRHSSMFGGRQFSTFDQGWIGWFCKKAVEKKINPQAEPFTISGNGKQVRDVLHAEDMKNLYRLAIQKIDDIKGHVFNIGGGYPNSISLIELFSLLEKKLSITLEYNILPVRESDQRVFIADILKAKSLLGWKPKVKKEDGISKMLDWLNEQY